MEKIERLYTLEDENKIWRILISESEKLILERRNTDVKEVFFAAYDLSNGNPLWENFQFEEKFWIGIEKIYKDVLYLHGFTKPDMPGHRGITAFDINAKKILWKNNDGVFAFVLNDKVYHYRDDFEGTKLEPLDYLSGETSGEIIDSLHEMEELREQAFLAEDFSDYVFPEKFYGDEPNAQQIEKAISKVTEGKDVEGEVEFAIRGNTFFASFHVKNSDSTMRNIFTALDLKSLQVFFENVLDESLDLFSADSFFLFKDYLFLIREKTKLDVYKITGE